MRSIARYRAIEISHAQAEPRAAVELTGAPPDLDEDVLQRVLGERPVPEDPYQAGEELRRSALIEALERLPVLARTSCQQPGNFGIRLGAH